MKLFAASLAAVALLSSASLAHADGPVTAPPPASRWYGYETLFTDAASVALMVAALRTPSGTPAQWALETASSAGYTWGGPAVHFARGNAKNGWMDLGVRLGAPLVAGVVGGVIGAATYHAPPCPPPSPYADGGGFGFCGGALDVLGGAFLGVLVGSVVGVGSAMVIDATVLARDPAPRPGTDRGSHASGPTIRWLPSLGAAPETNGGMRATLGVTGTF